MAGPAVGPWPAPALFYLRPGPEPESLNRSARTSPRPDKTITTKHRARMDLTQSTGTGVPLNHAPTTTTYKLLELPPELLALLESDHPPALRLESTPVAGLVRTPDNKTWSLRQKNTSNALIILQATQDHSLDAVATVHEMVELMPEAESAAAPTIAVKGKWHEKFGKTR